MRFVLALIILILPALAYAEADDFQSRAEKLWNDRDAQSVFEDVLKAFDNGEYINVQKLTELTGVREIQKLAEGSGDESAIFLDERFIALIKFTGGLRFYDIQKKDIIEIPGIAYPVGDTTGLIHREGQWIYFYRTDDKKSSIFELDLIKRVTRPIGDFTFRSYFFSTNESCSMLQITDTDNKMLKTFDLVNRKEILTNKQIYRAPSHSFMINAKVGPEKITFTIGYDVVEMRYPVREFSEGDINKRKEYYADKNNPRALLVNTLWYPGLNILFDLNRRKAVKVYLPKWLTPSLDGFGAGVIWKLIDNRMFLWCEDFEYRDKSGLYMIDFKRVPSALEFAQIILDYNLAHRQSGAGQSQSG